MGEGSRAHDCVLKLGRIGLSQFGLNGSSPSWLRDHDIMLSRRDWNHLMGLHRGSFQDWIHGALGVAPDGRHLAFGVELRTEDLLSRLLRGIEGGNP